MANSFKTRTKYSVSTNYFLQEDGNFWMLEDGTGTTASPTTTQHQIPLSINALTVLRQLF